METKNINPSAKSTAISNVEVVTLPEERHGKFRVLLHRRGLWLIGAILIVIAGVFGYNWMFGKAKVVYTTAAVERGDVENTVLAAGLVQPIKYVDVGAQTSGKLKSLKVKRGDRVEESQLLAEIDPILAQTALKSASATLENMTSQRSVREAELVLAKLQRDRNDLLFSHQVISSNDRDITKAAYDVAFADAASLSAQMKQATASVNTAKANLGYTQITAPMAGEVVSINMLEGQTLNANQSAPNILRIANLDTVTVWAQVSEADIDRVKLGQDVYFTVLGQSKHWNGKVRQILPTPELINNVVFYDVLFDIPNPERELHIQMTAQVYIVLSQAKDVLLIPTAAIGNASEGSEIQLQVMKEDGNVEIRTIKIGIKGEISTEVTDGLKEKELVVISEIREKVNTQSALSARKGPR
ncbi:MAG: efflux RND transporter periplasmic adaptor subunit [Bacteroidia bacterium]|nr:efflux RND transporter periplasmic adaptor subunit [Bacteroidia bacterium]